MKIAVTHVFTDEPARGYNILRQGNRMSVRASGSLFAGAKASSVPGSRPPGERTKTLGRLEISSDAPASSASRRDERKNCGFNTF